MNNKWTRWLCVGVLSAGIAWAAPGSVTKVVDINRASEAELVTLKGIGPKMAHHIIENREHAGPFPNLEAVSRVKGVNAHVIKRWVAHNPKRIVVIQPKLK